MYVMCVFFFDNLLNKNVILRNVLVLIENS